MRPSTATGLARRSHPAKLSADEETQVLQVLCSERFVDVGVAEIYATLLDEGIYLCSDSTMHRILRDHGLAGQRRQRQPGRHHKPRLVATAPNMMWVWDVSRLPGPRKGVWFYLYTIWGTCGPAKRSAGPSRKPKPLLSRRNSSPSPPAANG